MLVTPRLGFSLPHACNSMSFNRSGTRPPQALLSRTSIAAWARWNIPLCTKCLRCNVAVVVWALVLLPLLCFGADVFHAVVASASHCKSRSSFGKSNAVFKRKCLPNANTLSCVVSHVRLIGLAGQRKCARHRAACTSVVGGVPRCTTVAQRAKLRNKLDAKRSVVDTKHACAGVCTHFASNVNFGVRHKIIVTGPGGGRQLCWLRRRWRTCRRVTDMRTLSTGCAVGFASNAQRGPARVTHPAHMTHRRCGISAAEPCVSLVLRSSMQCRL